MGNINDKFQRLYDGLMSITLWTLRSLAQWSAVRGVGAYVVRSKHLPACRALPVFVLLALIASGCSAAPSPALSDLELSATETAAAPTAPPAPPPPTLLQGKRLCRGDFRGGKLIWVEDVDLTWQDNAPQETGYRIYKSRVPQDVLPPDATKYHIQFRYNQGAVDPPPDTFAVEAMNGDTGSSQATLDLPRCQ
jgi:hypothetical protein